ncbi:hypothetical protein MLD38_011853 [Melastoma candidum]|uniref:Uncharacterized protein n=1 Tax=Melastoma candidum TaxID=119954 RepID=A0ACB9R4G1_9MYRT|nr:hypothetical protein MLD38_011853 [Melastoma candidum]
MKAGKALHNRRAEIRVQFRTRSRYSKEIPDAYERLLLDAIEGERRLFIRSDELNAAWSLFTPVLKELEDKKVIPEYYPYVAVGRWEHTTWRPGTTSGGATSASSNDGSPTSHGKALRPSMPGQSFLHLLKRLWTNELDKESVDQLAF